MQYSKTRIFVCIIVENPICASVNSDLKLHKCGIPQQKPLLCVLLWKLSFVRVPTLTLNCTNAIIHRNKDVFLSVLQRKIRFVQLSTLTLNCTNAIYSTTKHVFFSVLLWKIRFMQESTLT